MSSPLTLDALKSAVLAELAAAWTRRAGAEVVLAPAGAAATSGWLVTIPWSGAPVGRVRLWIDAESAGREALAGGAAESDAAVMPATLAAWAAELVARITASPLAAGTQAGTPIAEPSAVPAGASTYQATWPDGTVSAVALAVDPPATAATTVRDSRLEAVLDVELPLVVRFGRTVMPLKAIAELGPGAVIDMGRSPDEPVDLLVGERPIGRGEVVIVGGNYGVRITELTGVRVTAGEREERAS